MQNTLTQHFAISSFISLGVTSFMHHGRLEVKQNFSTLYTVYTALLTIKLLNLEESNWDKFEHLSKYNF